MFLMRFFRDLSRSKAHARLHGDASGLSVVNVLAGQEELLPLKDPEDDGMYMSPEQLKEFNGENGCGQQVPHGSLSGLPQWSPSVVSQWSPVTSATWVPQWSPSVVSQWSPVYPLPKMHFPAFSPFDHPGAILV